MTHISSEQAMVNFGAVLGAALRGGEVLVLVGDVGAGKTTLVKGVAKGLEIDEDILSPSFTISRTYDARDGLVLSHYDFYRLDDAGIMKAELDESVSDPERITVIEWADIVSDILPDDHLVLQLIPTSESGREVTIQPNGDRAERVAGVLV